MSSSKVRVLVVEDDVEGAAILEAYLAREGSEVRIAQDGVNGLEWFHRWSPSIVLLDMMLPGIAGADLLAEIRRLGRTPVMMISAIEDESEKVGALRYGADDYVVKPCNPREVVARVHAVLRRTIDVMPPSALLRHEALEVDCNAMSAAMVEASGRRSPIELTPTEFSILATLLATPTKAFSRAELMERCMPGSSAMERAIDTHVHNLRKKLDSFGLADVLVTIRAYGYRFQ